jgi:NAD dependent epimerase/dehydratase family enzyme
MIAAQMVPIFSIFAGGPLGSGKQWLEYLFTLTLFLLT